MILVRAKVTVFLTVSKWIEYSPMAPPKHSVEKIKSETDNTLTLTISVNKAQEPYHNSLMNCR